MLTFIRRRDVLARTGLANSTLYLMISRGQFPRPVKLGPQMVGWPESEVTAWQKSKLAERDGKAA